MVGRKKYLLAVLLMAAVSWVLGCGSGGGPELTGTKAAQPIAADESGLARVLIGFDQVPGPAYEAVVQGVGGRVLHSFHLVPAIAAKIPVAAVEGLGRNPNVTYVEEDAVATAIAQSVPWGVTRIGASTLQAGGNKGTGVKVGIVDTGIYYSHPDLDGNYKGGYDFVNLDADPLDDNGHGTHVAGTVAAEDNSEGVVGVAPEAWLYAVKVLNASGSGYYSGIILGLQWCVDNGVQVANMSLGGSSDSSTLHAACDNAYAHNVVLVAAAGNSGNAAGQGDNIGYPARYSSVIAVGATQQNDTRASFSSTGPNLELVAPGVSILSTYLNNGYATGSGTSMASPHVAGVAALVIASGVSSAADVRSRLDTTADDLGAAGFDNLYGNGIVDAVEAAGGAPPPPPPPPPPLSLNVAVSTDKDSYSIGQTIRITVSVTDGSGAPVPGAAVHEVMTTASGKAYASDGTTNSSGNANFSRKTKRQDGSGTYTVTATATKDSASAQGSKQVTVK